MKKTKLLLHNKFLILKMMKKRTKKNINSYDLGQDDDEDDEDEEEGVLVLLIKRKTKNKKSLNKLEKQARK